MTGVFDVRAAGARINPARLKTRKYKEEAAREVGCERKLENGAKAGDRPRQGQPQPLRGLLALQGDGD